MKQNQMTKEEKEQENKLLKFNKTLENCTNQRLLNQSSRFMRGVKEYQRKPLLLTPTTAPYTSFPNRLPSYPCFLTWPTSSQQVAIVGWILFTRQGKFAKIRPSNISSVQIFRFVYNDVSPFFYFFVIFMVFFFRFFFFYKSVQPTSKSTLDLVSSFIANCARELLRSLLVAKSPCIQCWFQIFSRRINLYVIKN